MVTLLSIVYSDACDIVLVVTLLSIVYSDTCDIGFGGYIIEYCI